MSLNGRNRKRSPPRKTPFREPKRRILVVTEGEFTEPEYLKQLAIASRNPLLEIIFAPESGNDPKSIVGIAKGLLRESKRAARNHEDDHLRFESVWCVFDVDDHLRIPEAKEMALANGIELAISNPSFELWLLLHFRECPGMQHRDKILKLLKGYVAGYEKHVDFQLYSSGYGEAVRRATKMDDLAVALVEEGKNPTTGVYRLTELIRDF